MGKYFTILLLFLNVSFFCLAQGTFPGSQAVKSLAEDYMQLSRLGPGYSRNMSPEITDQFRALFDREAFLFWDLYRETSDSVLPPLPPEVYIDRARKTYHLKQPVLDYPELKITIEPDGKGAVIHLSKVNKVMDDEDKTLYNNKMKLRIQVSLEKEQPLIRSISEDQKASFFNSLSVGLNYIAWSSVIGMITQNPVIPSVSGEQMQELKITTDPLIQGGMMVEMRFNRENDNGLLFSTGLFYSQIPLSATVTNYSNSIPDTLGRSSASPIACTTFERSPEVWEKIAVRKIEIPLMLKIPVNYWIYTRAGIAPGYVTGASDVQYFLSRTGGGLVTELATLNQYYLDEAHEIDLNGYGYYRGKFYHFPVEGVLNKMVLSIQLAMGFEKQFKNFSIGMEPNLSFGTNPLSTRSFHHNYNLNTIQHYNTILESVKMPAFECAFGVRLMFSYLFNY